MTNKFPTSGRVIFPGHVCNYHEVEAKVLGEIVGLFDCKRRKLICTNTAAQYSDPQTEIMAD